MRVAFLGTPEPAAVALRAIVEAGHQVPIVITRADKRRGRNEKPRPSPVKLAAVELGLDVSHRPEDVLGTTADLGVVVAFGRIIKAEILDRLELVNSHFSLLPRWRGAAPVERAILAGDKETGVCLMKIDEGLDTGPVFRCGRVEIGVDETARELRARLAELSASMLVEGLARGFGEASPQIGEPTYAEKISAADLRLDWERSADELHRVVRLGRAWTTWRGRRLLVLAARPEESGGGGPPGTLEATRVLAGSGSLRLVTVQPEGRPPMDAADWVRGARLGPGERLGT